MTKYEVEYGAENDRHAVVIEGKRKDAQAFAADRENGTVTLIKPEPADNADTPTDPPTDDNA